MRARIPASLLLFGVFALPGVGQHTLSVTQPCGAGSVRFDVSGVAANAELYNLFNLTPHNPTGGGPIFGLGLAGSEILLSQILLPLGAAPVHVPADGTGTYAWQSCAAPQGVSISADVVSVEWGASGYVGQSPVVNVTLDL